MAINISKINKTSAETKSAIQRKSAQSLPNNPSERGYSAEEIKKRFYQPIIDAANSAIAETDRVVDETNSILEKIGTDFNDFIESTEINDACRIVFNNENWILNETNNMYEVFITKEKHGITDYTKIGVDMFLLDGNGTYVKVNQFDIQFDGTVRCFHEANGAGHVTIYEKREGFVVGSSIVEVDKIEGLAKVAKTNNYNDLDNIPDESLSKLNEIEIAKIIAGTQQVGKAKYSENAESAVYAQTCDSASNANFAISANQDNNGNIISSTYAKIDEMNAQFSIIEDKVTSLASRLTSLGFKQGSITFQHLPAGVTVTQNKLFRQGNFVIGTILFDFTNYIPDSDTTITFNLPDDFKIKYRTPATYIFGKGYGATSLGYTSQILKPSIYGFFSNDIYLNTSGIDGNFFQGNITFAYRPSAMSEDFGSNTDIVFNFGYEAEPLT